MAVLGIFHNQISILSCDTYSLACTDATLSPVKKIRGPRSESLIEQEIRQQKEKEREYRREKGLLMSPPPSPAGEMTDSVSQGVTEGGEQGATCTCIAKEQAGSPTASKEVYLRSDDAVFYLLTFIMLRYSVKKYESACIYRHFYQKCKLA